MTILYVLAVLLIIIGLAGIVLPAIPGVPLMFVGMLLAAWGDGFTHLRIGYMVALGILTLLSIGVDFWAAALGAKRVGASRLALIGAVIGTVAGLFFGPIGLFVGPFAGAMIGQLMHGRKLDTQGIGHATRVGLGTWLGIVFGVALKLMLALAMIGLFAWAWWH